MEQEVVNILGVEESKNRVTYNDINDYSGSGARMVNALSKIFYGVSVIFLLIGILLLFNWGGRTYKEGALYAGLVCIAIALSSFVIAPIYKCLGTITEAAHRYKQLH